MEDSSSCGNCPDMEPCMAESKSNQSLSVGCFPDEGSADCEDDIPCEELPSEGSSCRFLPPVQGAWGMKRIWGPMEKQDHSQDNPENLGEETIMEVLDAYLGSHSEDSVADQTLCEGDQKVGKCPKERINQTLWDLDDLMKNLKAFLDNLKDDENADPVLSDSPQEEDLQLPSALSAHRDQISHQEQEACQDLPKCTPAENGDIDQFLELPPGLEYEEIVEMDSQESGTAETCSVSSEQSKEEDGPSDKETTCCLSLRFCFQWLRKRVVSSLPGRKHPGRANKGPPLQALKRRLCFGGNRILPQESLLTNPSS